ncbi:hypothetical protein [Campylobacter coli]|uniref:hypothetical protein n=1 Tax=Campylobacter coli TaxID=195 RepID=UPI000A6BF9BF|nr:hypothetical protein [Campylobacter coli]
MINGINSYSNYNYTNNTSNTKSSNVIANNNLVSDKSQAVDKILGYGVIKRAFLQVILTKQQACQKIIRFMQMV